jgi:hypothetical protein
MSFQFQGRTFATAAELVATMFSGIVRRPPDEAGLAFWTQVIENGLPPADMASLLRGSEEVVTVVEPVIRLFEAAFGRQPDPAGLDFWASQLRNGVPVNDVARELIGSDEFAERYNIDTSNPDRGAIIEALYQNVLGRAPDATGSQFWQSTEADLSLLLLSFAQSTEFVERADEQIAEFLDISGSGQTPPPTESLFDDTPPVTPPVDPPVTPPVTPPVQPPVQPPVTPPVTPPVVVQPDPPSPPPPPAPSYSVSVSPASVAEGNAVGQGGNVITFAVTRSGDTSAAGAVVVSLSGTASGTGTGADYTVVGLTNGVLSFAAGAPSASFTVTTVPDITFELDETVTATLSSVLSGGGTIVASANSATATILGDETQYSLSPVGQRPDIAENGGSLSFTITRAGVTSSAGTVFVELAGDATRGTDYTLTGAAFINQIQVQGGQPFDRYGVTFEAGEQTKSLVLQANDDQAFEQRENVTISLHLENAGANQIAPGAALRVTITDNDPKTFTASIGPDGAVVFGGNGATGPINAILAGTAVAPTIAFTRDGIPTDALDALQVKSLPSGVDYQNFGFDPPGDRDPFGVAVADVAKLLALVDGRKTAVYNDMTANTGANAALFGQLVSFRTAVEAVVDAANDDKPANLTLELLQAVGTSIGVMPDNVSLSGEPNAKVLAQTALLSFIQLPTVMSNAVLAAVEDLPKPFSSFSELVSAFGAIGPTQANPTSPLLGFDVGGKKFWLVDPSPARGYDTIQEAVNAANNGNMVFIANGTYREQVTIDAKTDLTIRGVSETGVIIRDPAGTVISNGTWGSDNVVAIISVDRGTNISLKNLTVDGGARGWDVGSSEFVGVYFKNTSGLVEDVTIKGIRDAGTVQGASDNGPSGMQRGIGLVVNNEDGTLRTFSLTDSTIRDFQKNGTWFGKADLTVTGNEIIGVGATTVIGQNGFQIARSTGEIEDNIITEMAWTGWAGPPNTPWYSSGIIAYENENLIVDNNTITGAGTSGPGIGQARFAGIDWSDNSGGSISGNTIDTALYGVVAYGYPTAASGTDSLSGLVIGANTYTNITVLGVGINEMGSEADNGSVGQNVIGSNFADYLGGNLQATNDTLNGAAESDTLIGGLGADSLTGGTGNDFFIFAGGTDAAGVMRATSLGVDRITDFNPVDDTLQFSEAVFGDLDGSGGVGSVAAAKIGLIATRSVQLDGSIRLGTSATVDFATGALIVVGANGEGPVELFYVASNVTTTETLAAAVTANKAVKIADITLVGSGLTAADFVGIA